MILRTTTDPFGDTPDWFGKDVLNRLRVSETSTKHLASPRQVWLVRTQYNDGAAPLGAGRSTRGTVLNQGRINVGLPAMGTLSLRSRMLETNRLANRRTMNGSEPERSRWSNQTDRDGSVQPDVRRYHKLY
jgi:hypothetical protein